MLTGNCQKAVASLIRQGDFNTRVTVVPKCDSEVAWHEWFHDVFGNAINELKLYEVECTTYSNEHLTLNKKNIMVKSFTDIINPFWDKMICADGVRLTLTAKDNGSSRSWIVVEDK